MTQDVNPFVMDTTGLSCCSAALCPEQCDKQAPGNREGAMEGLWCSLPACLALHLPWLCNFLLKLYVLDALMTARSTAISFCRWLGHRR